MARNLRIVQARMDLLKQVIYIVERSSSKEDALRRLSKLLEDPAVKRALKDRVSE